MFWQRSWLMSIFWLEGLVAGDAPLLACLAAVPPKGMCSAVWQCLTSHELPACRPLDVLLSPCSVSALSVSGPLAVLTNLLLGVQDVVYYFAPAEDATITVSLCSSFGLTFDTKLYVLSNLNVGPTGGPIEAIACNDDLCGYRSQLQVVTSFIQAEQCMLLGSWQRLHCCNLDEKDLLSLSDDHFLCHFAKNILGLSTHQAWSPAPAVMLFADARLAQLCEGCQWWSPALALTTGFDHPGISLSVSVCSMTNFISPGSFCLLMCCHVPADAGFCWRGLWHSCGWLQWGLWAVQPQRLSEWPAGGHHLCPSAPVSIVLRL